MDASFALYDEQTYKFSIEHSGRKRLIEIYEPFKFRNISNKTCKRSIIIIPDVENKVISGNEEFPDDTQDTKLQIEMD